MHQPHQQSHQPFEPIHQARRTFGPIDAGHQGLSHQGFGPMHQNYQNYQAHGHQPLQDYQVQPHQAHRHQPLQDYQVQPHQAHQDSEPMHQGLSQHFKDIQQGFSHVPRALSYNNHQDIPQDRANPSNPSPLPHRAPQIESRSQQVLQENSQDATSQPSAPESQLQLKSKKGKKNTAPIPKDSTESTHNILNGFSPKSSYDTGLHEINPKGPSAEELMASKSLDQLQLSANVGKSILSRDDQIHFHNLDSELSKALAVNCIGRGVKLSAVETYLKPFRDPSSWHGFTQAPKTRVVYKEQQMQS